MNSGGRKKYGGRVVSKRVYFPLWKQVYGIRFYIIRKPSNVQFSFSILGNKMFIKKVLVKGRLYLETPKKQNQNHTHRNVKLSIVSDFRTYILRKNFYKIEYY